MSTDPRAVANALLDRAEASQMYLTNLSLNKILFFAHAEYLVIKHKPLINMTFEAWEFGPVMPIIYRQFKCFGAGPIKGRAFQICQASGEDVEFDYASLRIDQDFIVDIVSRYASLPASKLVAISHEDGGPWHQVWYGATENQFGMAIPNNLIAKNFLLPGGRARGLEHVH